MSWWRRGREAWCTCCVPIAHAGPWVYGGSGAGGGPGSPLRQDPAELHGLVSDGRLDVWCSGLQDEAGRYVLQSSELLIHARIESGRRHTQQSALATMVR